MNSHPPMLTLVFGVLIKKYDVDTNQFIKWEIKLYKMTAFYFEEYVMNILYLYYNNNMIYYYYENKQD